MTRVYIIVNVQYKGGTITPIFLTARTNKEEAERVAHLYKDYADYNVEIWDYAFDEAGKLVMGGI